MVVEEKSLAGHAPRDKGRGRKASSAMPPAQLDPSQKTKYFVTGGFLGSGKTTSTLAFAEVMNRKYGTPRIIANDLGVTDIVDGLYSEQSEFFGDQITNGCICYCTDDLIFTIKQQIKDGARIVLSDIPGC